MDTRLLAATVGLLAALIAACLLPVSADSAEDRGDGRAEVIIRRHVKTSPYRPRTWVFLAVTAVFGLIFLELRRPWMPGAYTHLVTGVASAITRDPASVSGYAARLHPAAQFFAVAVIGGLTVVARSSMLRRIAILSHAVLYIVISVLAQALMIVAGIATHWVVGPSASRRRWPTCWSAGWLSSAWPSRPTCCRGPPRCRPTAPAGYGTTCWPAAH
jgi:hypothetical protein